MKKCLLSILMCLILLISLSGAVCASDTVVSGSIYFSSTLISPYMQKHGFIFIKEGSHDVVYAAPDAEITVTNKEDDIVGQGRTDTGGHFSISVPEVESYMIVVRFHEHEYKHEVPNSERDTILIRLGLFRSDEVDRWIDASIKSR